MLPQSRITRIKIRIQSLLSGKCSPMCKAKYNFSGILSQISSRVIGITLQIGLSIVAHHDLLSVIDLVEMRMEQR